MLVAQNFLTVKMAGRSFGRKQNYGLTVTEWWRTQRQEADERERDWVGRGPITYPTGQPSES